MKKLITVLVVSIVMFSSNLMADPVASGTTAKTVTVAAAPILPDTSSGTVTVPITVSATEVEPTTEEFQGAIKTAVDSWKTYGWVAGMAAIISLLLLVLRLKLLNAWMEAKKIKWTKPYIALVLGALAGFFSSMATGAGMVPSLMAGIMAGMLSPGIHNVLTMGNK